MKTKLLKKIRKMYTITRVDEIASDAGSMYKAVELMYGTPFYVITDTSREHYGRNSFYATFKEAQENLCEWIIKDYSEKFRHTDEKSSKVWWLPK